MKSYILLIGITLFTFSCSKKDAIEVITDCPQIQLSNDIPSIQYSNIAILEVKIVDHCLQVKLGYSGCNQNHEIDLVTNGSIMESLPPQILLSFVDKQPEACLAYFEESFEYDLKTVDDAMGNETTIILRFNKSDKRIEYIR